MNAHPSTATHTNPQLISLPPRTPRQKKHGGGDGLRPPDQIQKQPEPEQSIRLANPVIGPKDGIHFMEQSIFLA
jgi:hypothetical protein